MLSVRVPPSAQDFAVDSYGPFPQSRQIHNGPQAAADQPLDFRGSSVHTPLAIAWSPRARTPRQHVVFGGHPAFSLPLQPGWNPRIHTGRAQQAGLIGCDQHAARRGADEPSFDRNGSQLVRLATVVSGPRCHLFVHHVASPKTQVDTVWSRRGGCGDLFARPAGRRCAACINCRSADAARWPSGRADDSRPARIRCSAVHPSPRP